MGITAPGWPIIGAFVAVGAGVTSAAMAILGPWGWSVAVVASLLVAWCVWFFRDPDRATPTEAGVVISPADGVVCQIVEQAPARGVIPGDPLPPDRPVTRISVFMNVFDVHVNRAPADGVVESLSYVPGRFFNASFDKASEHNERLAMTIRLPDGRRCVCVQIAGLVARRIVCQAREGIQVARGHRYGLIRFGSRVDVYLPDGYAPCVQVGQRAVAGATVISRRSLAITLPDGTAPASEGA
ncbi:MAG: phosphatidylserine decarboxylase [Phycisphaerae bacterium]|nr:phosphatidylserine decarboxylase [Phycisphaerae bacterium]